MSIHDIWAQIEAWLAEQDGSFELNGPASPAALGKLQSLAPEIPPDLLDSLRVHNGQHFNAESFLSGYVLLSIDAILKTLVTLKKVAAAMGEIEVDADPGIRPLWWSEQWIPFAMAEPRDQLMLDLDPAPGGKFGQVVRYWGDDPKRRLVAPSLEAWLTACTSQLSTAT